MRCTGVGPQAAQVAMKYLCSELDYWEYGNSIGPLTFVETSNSDGATLRDRSSAASLNKKLTALSRIVVYVLKERAVDKNSWIHATYVEGGSWRSECNMEIYEGLAVIISNIVWGYSGLSPFQISLARRFKSKVKHLKTAEKSNKYNGRSKLGPVNEE